MSVSEIARRAGVSIATVSRVLNNHPRVRPETVEQVQSVLRDFPYNPLAVRRGPRPGKRSALPPRTRNVAVIVLGKTQEVWFRTPVYASVVAGVTSVARDLNLNVTIDGVLDGDELDRTLDTAGSLDGAIAFVPAPADAQLLERLRARVPTVRVMGEETGAAVVDEVRPDNLLIGRLAYEHLAGSGHERLGFVTTRPESAIFFLRYMGFAVAASRAGRPVPHAFVAGRFEPAAFGGATLHRGQSLAELADLLVAAPVGNRPSALFVSQDVETIGLYPLLAQRGVWPGRDVAIVSCNNEASGLAMLSPRPASIDVGAEEVGRRAVAQLLHRMAHPDEPPVRTLVAPRLVVPEA